MNVLEIPALPIATSFIQLLIAVLLIINITLSFRVEKLKRFIPFIKHETIESIEEKLSSFDEDAYPRIITDETGIVSSINQEAENLFGYNEKEWRGNNLDRIIPEKYKHGHNEGIKSMVGKPFLSKTFNLSAINSLGKEFPIELILRKKIINGRAFYSASIRDTTKEEQFKKNCEKEIQLIKLQLSIVDKGEEIGNYSSWIWDIKTGKISASDGYKKLTHIDFSLDYKIDHVYNKVWEDDKEIMSNAMYQATVEGKDFEVKYKMYRADDFKVLYLHTKVTVEKDTNGIPIFLHGSTSLIKVMTIREAENKEYE